MPIQFGRTAYIALNEESTYGTANGSPFGVNNRVFSVSMGRSQERERTTHLSQSSAAFAVNTFDGFEIAGGTIETPLTYKGLGMLFKAAIGSASSAASGALFLHTFTPSADLPSLTIAVQRGTGSSEQFEGCMVSNMTISCEAGGEGRASFEIIAETATARASSIGAPGFGDGTQIFHFQAGTLSFNSATYKMRSMELSLDNKLERVNHLGSKLTAQPQISDVREVTLTVTLDLEDDNLYNAQLTPPSAQNVEVSFTNGTDIFGILIRNAEITDYSDDITSFGRIERTVTFFGLSDASNEALRIEITNDASSAISN